MNSSEGIRLQKILSQAGIASRRAAEKLIEEGRVSVNGRTVREMGVKADPAADDIKVDGRRLRQPERHRYILLNKPAGVVTTRSDPQRRRTVIDLVGVREYVYPVGRLDYDTEGLLLLTNDGELAQKLTHPKHEIKKIYHVQLNRPLDKNDFDKILKGVVLEDGPASVDVLAYADSKDKTQIGVEIHSGRNRIVRRIFESLGYDVRQLDRVMFAGLTKKNIERGKWRFLSEREVRELKHFT